MSAPLTLSAELSDRLAAQADVAGHPTVESLLASLLDAVEPADAAEARRLRRARAAERDAALSEAAAEGWRDWPEIEEPAPRPPERAGVPLEQACGPARERRPLPETQPSVRRSRSESGGAGDQPDEATAAA